MTAAIHTLPRERPPLRAALLPGAGAAAEAVVRAYLGSIELAVGPPDPDADLALVWWEGTPPPGGRFPEVAVPLVALCAGGSAVLAAALDAGVDHAVALPVSADLLRALCQASARRWAPGAPAPAPRPPARPDGPLRLDDRARTLVVRGRPVSLTLREFDLLSYLVRNAGAACSRDELLAGVWGIDFETGTNTVDVFIYALRRKLRGAGLPGAIETVRGVGYRLASDLH